MNTILGLMKDVLKMKPHWAAFVGLLLAINMIGPLFFLSSLEAKVVLGTIMGNAMLMMILYAEFGFVRLLGAGHILWLPMLPWLVSRLCTLPTSALTYWLWAIVVIDGFAAIIDITDVVRYIRGERAPTV